MFQKWFQSNFGKTPFLNLTWMVSLIPLVAQAATLAPSSPRVPQLLQEVEKKYARAQTLSAQFSQANLNQTLGKRKLSSGILLVKRPSQVRWETQKPEPNLLVSNGKVFTFYTPPFYEGDPGQIIEKPAAEVQSQLADALLSGAFSLSQAKTIAQKGPYTFQFVPKTGTAGSVMEAWIEIQPQMKVIEKVTLIHKGGNRAEILLSNIQLGLPLSDELFRFTPPPQTDRVHPGSN